MLFSIFKIIFLVLVAKIGFAFYFLDGFITRLIGDK